MKKWKYTELLAKAAVVVLLLCSVMVVPLFRPAGEGIAGRESYLYLRLAEDMDFRDSYSFGGRPAAYEWGLPLIASISPSAASRMLPPVIGILIALMFYLILKKLNVECWKLCMGMLALSPPFIYLSNTFNKYAPAMLLAMVSYYFILGQRRHEQDSAWRRLCRIIPALFIPVFSMAVSLLFIILLAVHYIGVNRIRARDVILAETAAFASYALFLVCSAGMPGMFSFSSGGFAETVNSLISDFGGTYGFGLFGVAAAIFGGVSLWRKKYKRPEVFLSIVSLVTSSFFIKSSIFVILPFMVYLSAKGIDYAFKKEWSDDALKLFTILILICGIIFSSVSYSKELVDRAPDSSKAEAISKLAQMPEGTVFSDYKNGYWIAYARKKNIMDEWVFFISDAGDRYRDMKSLLNARLMSDAEPIIRKYNIKYFWIDNRMRREWWDNKDEQGLQFLLNYGGAFRRIYANGSEEIWEFIGQTEY